MSKYVEIFQAAEKEFTRPPVLDSDILLVRVLPEVELKTKSGIIVSSDPRKQTNSINSTKPIFAEVLKCGKGYYKEEGEHLEEIPLDAKPGDIIAVGQNSAPIMLRYGDVVLPDGFQVAYVRANEVIERWPSGTYSEYFSYISSRLFGGA